MWHGKRKLYPEEELTRVHAHGKGHFNGFSVDVADSLVGAGKKWSEGVEGKNDDSGEDSCDRKWDEGVKSG